MRNENGKSRVARGSNRACKKILRFPSGAGGLAKKIYGFPAALAGLQKNFTASQRRWRACKKILRLPSGAGELAKKFYGLPAWLASLQKKFLAFPSAADGPLQTRLQRSQRGWRVYKRVCNVPSAAGGFTKAFATFSGAAGGFTNVFATFPARLGSLQTPLQSPQRSRLARKMGLSGSAGMRANLFFKE